MDELKQFFQKCEERGIKVAVSSLDGGYTIHSISQEFFDEILGYDTNESFQAALNKMDVDAYRRLAEWIKDGRQCTVTDARGMRCQNKVASYRQDLPLAGFKWGRDDRCTGHQLED
jgi:hypothetical protein